MKRGRKAEDLTMHQRVSSEWIDIEPPTCLHPQAKPFWDELVADLNRWGKATEIDRYAVAMLANAQRDYQAAVEVLDREGTVCVSEKGSPYQHPAVGQKNKADDKVRQYLKELQLTKSSSAKRAPRTSRAKLGIDQYVVN